MDCIYPGPAVSAAEAGRDQIHPTLGIIRVGLNTYAESQAAGVEALIASGLLAPATTPEPPAAPRQRRGSRFAESAPSADADATAPMSEE